MTNYQTIKYYHYQYSFSAPGGGGGGGHFIFLKHNWQGQKVKTFWGPLVRNLAKSCRVWKPPTLETRVKLIWPQMCATIITNNKLGWTQAEAVSLELKAEKSIELKHLFIFSMISQKIVSFGWCWGKHSKWFFTNFLDI